MTHPEANTAPLIEHLIELKRRVLWAVGAWLVAFGLCYLVVEPIYMFLVEPLAHSFGPDSQRRLIYTGLTETFITYIKLAFYSGFFLAFPVIAAQVYLFLAPALYKREKWVLMPYLVFAPLLFFAGAALCYFFVIPMAWKFFISFEVPAASAGMAIQLEAKVSEYLSLVIQLLCAFGLSFQLPIVITLLVRVGLINTATLRRGRRYAVVIIVTLAGILTPPDILSQIALFIPLYLLYELSIVAAASIEKRHLNDTQNETETESDHA